MAIPLNADMSMEMTTDHYDMYHKTIPGSDTPYESYLIKFSPEFTQPFTDANYHSSDVC